MAGISLRVAVAVVLTACLTLVTPVPFQPVPHPGDDAEGSLDAAADVRSLWDVSLLNANTDQWHCRCRGAGSLLTPDHIVPST